MKKKTARILALLLAAMMVLSACGNNGDSNKDNQGTTPDTPTTDGDTPSTPTEPTEPSEPQYTPVKNWVTYGTIGGDMATFMHLNSESANELDYTHNMITFLLEVDNHGRMKPAAAKDWYTNDNGKTWTFELRDDVVWVDVNGNEKAKTVAHDWMTSLEWVLNFHKNGGKNSSMPREMIAGADEYYTTVKDMSEEEAKALTADGELFRSTVGIECPDDYTIVYTCVDQCPYFDSLALSAALYPLSQAQVDEMGVDGVYEQDNTTMWYNGPYLMKEFIYNNSKYFEANPAYWDKDCTLFDSLTVLMVDDSLMGQTMFFNGDVDTCTLGESNLSKILEEGESNEWYQYLRESRQTKYSYQAHFNYSKLNDDGTPDDNWNTAVANEAFRKSLYYGMDLTNNWRRTNQMHPEKLENVIYTAPNLCFFEDGTDYADRVRELIGLPDGTGRYDAAKAQQYKEQAMAELAGKVEFPIELRHFISGSSNTALDGAVVLKEIVEALGTDYIVMTIDTYTSSVVQEVYNLQRHCWTFGNGWGADYADPQNFLSQECYNVDGAYYTENYSYTNEATDPELIAMISEFTDMVVEANKITGDMDARYEAYAQAEAFMLEHAYVIPTSYSISVGMSKNNPWAAMFSPCGAQNGMWKNWQTKAEAPFTTEEIAQFEAAYHAEG